MSTTTDYNNYFTSFTRANSRHHELLGVRREGQSATSIKKKER
jgi:hypothetical protein